MRYVVQKTHDGRGSEFIGNDGPQAITTLETDDFNEAWAAMFSGGGMVFDRQDRRIYDRSGESCSFEDAGAE